jgi:AP-4 complex subunit sigma-1
VGVRLSLSLALSLLQIMFNLEKAHILLDEMVMNGQVVETSRVNIVYPLAVMDKAGQ